MWKFLIITIIFLLFNYTISSDFDKDNSGVILTKPICNITNYDQTAFNEFAKKEECRFQIFMDKIKELDCFVLSGDMEKCYVHNAIDENCSAKVEIERNKVYDIRKNISCPCSNPIDDQNYNVKENSTSPITNLDEYIECWSKLWQKMIENAISVINKMPNINDPSIKTKCKNFGNFHSQLDRCKTYTVEPY